MTVDPRFAPHNTHREDPSRFSTLDPQLRELGRLPIAYPHPSSGPPRAGCAGRLPPLPAVVRGVRRGGRSCPTRPARVRGGTRTEPRQRRCADARVRELPVARRVSDGDQRHGGRAPRPIIALRNLVAPRRRRIPGSRSGQLPLTEVTRANRRSICAAAAAGSGPRAKEAALARRWSTLPVPDSTVLTPG